MRYGQVSKTVIIVIVIIILIIIKTIMIIMDGKVRIPNMADYYASRIGKKENTLVRFFVSHDENIEKGDESDVGDGDADNCDGDDGRETTTTTPTSLTSFKSPTLI